MRVLIFHGYLLHGTGSNVYTSSLCRALALRGHEVHLLSQEREPESLEWVDSVGRFNAGGPVLEQLREPAGAGSVTVYRPEIGPVLPVYVADDYAGFTVKRFTDLEPDELDHYLDANVGAVRAVASAAGGIDAALANHLVMGPVVMARSGLAYAVKIHGSALSYTVLPELERFGPYAREGLAGSSGVLVGSNHIAERLDPVLDDTQRAKVRLGPPGVDTELFAPLGRSTPAEALIGTADAIQREAESGPGVGQADAFTRDPAEAVAGLRWFAAAEGPRILFVGKLLEAKGVEELARAWPPVVDAHPRARLLFAGFGEHRPALERLITELGVSDTVRLCGRLDHDEVAPVMAAADALVVPSVFPEAFGMVAAEAAAAGTLPVCADHSGLSEVAGELAAVLDPGLAHLTRFEAVAGESHPEIASRLLDWLSRPPAERLGAERALRDHVVRRWSWDAVAGAVLDASAGRLDSLPRPVIGP